MAPPAASAPSFALASPAQSIFTKLLLLTLVIALVPLAALGLGMIGVNAEELRNSSRLLHLAIVENAQRAVRAEVGNAREEIAGVGQILLGNGQLDDQKRIELAGLKVTQAGLFDSVTLYDTTGHRMGAIKAKEAADPSLAEVMDPPLLARVKPGAFVAGDIHKGPRGPELDIYVPVEIDGEVRGIIGASIGLTSLCQQLGRLGEEMLSARDSVFAVDAQRRIAAAGDPARVIAREPLAGRGIFKPIGGSASFQQTFGASPEFELDGVPMLGAIITVPELGWAVVAQRPRAVAYATLQQLRTSVLLALLAAAAFAIASAIAMARGLTRPIARLVAATREIATRKFTRVAPDLSGRKDELGSLGRAFDQMSTDLDVSEKKLVEETRVRGVLSRYLPGDVVEYILRDPSRLRLGGERRDVTIMFCDVVGFTKLSENREPEVVVAILNELFTIATEIIQKQGGIVDKFIGDCVMAVWGTPTQRPDDAERAVTAAEDIRRWVESANRKWKQKWGVELQLAIGLNTGHAVAGNIGSEKRVEYTVIGDAVNVAARLEGLAQPNQILMTEATKEKLPADFPLRLVGEQTLLGRKAPIKLWEVSE